MRSLGKKLFPYLEPWRYNCPNATGFLSGDLFTTYFTCRSLDGRGESFLGSEGFLHHGDSNHKIPRLTMPLLYPLCHWCSTASVVSSLLVLVLYDWQVKWSTTLLADTSSRHGTHILNQRSSLTFGDIHFIFVSKCDCDLVPSIASSRTWVGLDASFFTARGHRECCNRKRLCLHFSWPPLRLETPGNEKPV